jgi:hypothetical protein
MIENFNHTVNHWLSELEGYSFNELCSKPSAAGWSLGQLYRHLINDANFYIEQIEVCVRSNDHTNEEASAAGKEMLVNNEFPNEIIEGDPANAFIPQPESKEKLLLDLVLLKEHMNKVAVMIRETLFRGKTKHPGLNYFSAVEWLQFADMHFRHHLRQKKRIDEFLGRL